MMPMDMSKYPVNWRDISLRIRERDGWRCKFCGAENGKPNPLTGSKVVLTVAHLHNPDPMCVDDDNLASLCQACHNKLDAPMRAQHSRRTRQHKAHEALTAAGQGELFAPPSQEAR